MPSSSSSSEEYEGQQSMHQEGGLESYGSSHVTEVCTFGNSPNSGDLQKHRHRKQSAVSSSVEKYATSQNNSNQQNLHNNNNHTSPNNIVGSGRSIFGGSGWGAPQQPMSPHFVEEGSESGVDNASWSLTSPRATVVVVISPSATPPLSDLSPHPPTANLTPPRHQREQSSSSVVPKMVDNSFSGWDQGHIATTTIAPPPSSVPPTITATRTTSSSVHEYNANSHSAIILFTPQHHSGGGNDDHTNSSTPSRTDDQPTSLPTTTPSSTAFDGSNIGIAHRPTDQSCLSSACGVLFSASLHKDQATRQPSIRLTSPTTKSRSPQSQHQRPQLEDSCGWLREKSFLLSRSDVGSAPLTHIPTSPRHDNDEGNHHRDRDTPLKIGNPHSEDAVPHTEPHPTVHQHHPHMRSKMVIVLGLEGTLIHASRTCITTNSTPSSDEVQQGALILTKRGGHGGTSEEYASVAYRPHIAHFIGTVLKHFDIAIFSTGEQDYVDALLDVMDPSGQVFPKSRRYYRQHCTKVVSRTENGQRSALAKNLHILGRPLNEVVLVDDTTHSGALQPNNLLLLPTWTGDPTDTALLQLATNLSHNAQNAPQ